MKAVGLDTCVILRLLVGEPHDQAIKAKSYVDAAYYGGQDVCVSDLAVAEAYYAIQHHYGVPEAKALEALTVFLSSSKITPTGKALTLLSDYSEKGPGFIDRLLRLDLLSHVDEIATFDKEFAKLENMQDIG